MHEAKEQKEKGRKNDRKEYYKKIETVDVAEQNDMQAG